MKKRNHKEVNPKNHYYDKFYLINYLEVGKRWLDVLALDFEDTSTAFQDSEDEEEELTELFIEMFSLFLGTLGMNGKKIIFLMIHVLFVSCVMLRTNLLKVLWNTLW